MRPLSDSDELAATFVMADDARYFTIFFRNLKGLVPWPTSKRKAEGKKAENEEEERRMNTHTDTHTVDQIPLLRRFRRFCSRCFCGRPSQSGTGHPTFPREQKGRPATQERRRKEGTVGFWPSAGRRRTPSTSK